MRRLRRFARWMDAELRVPFTPLRIGLDPISGLVPGLGDARDVAWQANLRTVTLLQRHVGDPPRAASSDRRFVVLAVGGAFLGAALLRAILP